MKHSKFTIDNKTTSKKRVLGLLTFVFVFFFINSIQMTLAKSSNSLKANVNKKFEALNSVEKEKSQIKGIEEQDITINILNNETYFIGSAQGKIKLKQNQINVKNKNFYGSVLNVLFNETQVKNLSEQRKNDTQINLSPVNHLNDFFEYFPNFGKMKSISEMELDLRYIWNCTYKQLEEANSISIMMDLISKESATQHGFKVEFRFNSEKNTKELLRDYFENFMKVCVITQKSATELKRELHKLIVKTINIKKHMEKAGEAKPNNPNANGDGSNAPGKKMDGNVFDKNPFADGGQNNTNPNSEANDQGIQPMPEPNKPEDLSGPLAPENPVAPIPTPEQPQDNGNPNGGASSPVVDPVAPVPPAPIDPIAPAPDAPLAPTNPEPQIVNGDPAQKPENLSKISGKINNKTLKAVSFLQKRENAKIKNGKKQDIIEGPNQTDTNQLGGSEASRNPNNQLTPNVPEPPQELGNSEASRNPNKQLVPDIPEPPQELGNSEASRNPNKDVLAPVPVPQPEEMIEPPRQDNQTGNTDASKNPQQNQGQIVGPEPIINNPNEDGNGLNPILPPEQNFKNSTINNNNNNLNNNNNSTNEPPHIHKKDTIVSNKADNVGLKPEDITDPLARQKYQKAESELTKTKDKLKLLADKKKEIVKGINDLYNKINSELQSKDILHPIAEMDKSKLDKAQQVIEQAKKESEQIRKQSEDFLAQKQALNVTQESKMKETQTLEKNFQEHKGKMDQINQKKKDTADTISQYNSYGELAAKKLKANLEKKIELQKQMDTLHKSLDKSAKYIEEKSQDVKSTQQTFDDLTNKVEKLKNEIKLFEESQKNVIKKQDEIGKRIDTAEAEKLKKQGYEALTKLSGLDGPLEKAKKAVLELVDSSVLTVVENSFNMVIDKDNNDSSAFEREMSKIPKFVWTPKK